MVAANQLPLNIPQGRMFGVSGGIRTPGPLLRRQLLYPTELQTHKLERVMGIEPTRPAWKAGILPLNYTRIRLRRLQPTWIIISKPLVFVNSFFQNYSVPRECVYVRDRFLYPFEFLLISYTISVILSTSLMWLNKPNETRTAPVRLVPSVLCASGAQ